MVQYDDFYPLGPLLIAGSQPRADVYLKPSASSAATAAMRSCRSTSFTSRSCYCTGRCHRL